MNRRQVLAQLALALCAAPFARAAKSKEADDAAKDAKHRKAIADFLSGPIGTIQIQLGKEEINALRKDPRHYVEGALVEGDKTRKGIGFKLKGADGSFRPVDEKPCFTINFDKFKGGDRFHGLKKLHLNNAREDESFLRQLICGEMARAAGVPALRCTHVFVKLNERDLGLYVLAEGYTKDFLSLFFVDTSGDVYESGFCKDIDDGLMKDEGDEKDFRAIQQLLAACREEDAAARWTKLRAILDVDRFASFLAMESLMGVGDGYDFFRNNYRIYHDPKTKLISFIPHGMDQPLSDVGFSVQKQPESIVGRAFTSCVEGRKLYRERVIQLNERVFAKRDWSARVAEVAAKVSAAFAANGRKPNAELAKRMDDLVKTVRERIANIQEQLTDLPEPLEFDKSGAARITKGWTTKQEGEVKFDRVKDDRGEQCLRIVAMGESQASWRAAAQLAPGRYTFEGQVKTVGVRNGEGVCLRISGSDPTGEWIAGDAPWKPARYNFEVPDDGGEIVLVAELRAGKGEAWFAADSLRLIRAKA